MNSICNKLDFIKIVNYFFLSITKLNLLTKIKLRKLGLKIYVEKVHVLEHPMNKLELE